LLFCYLIIYILSYIISIRINKIYLLSFNYYYNFIIKLINIFTIKVKIFKLEINKKSLIKVLNSELLYDDFLDYCNKKCCGEYAVSLFNKN